MSNKPPKPKTWPRWLLTITTPILAGRLATHLTFEPNLSPIPETYAEFLSAFPIGFVD